MQLAMEFESFMVELRFKPQLWFKQINAIFDSKILVVVPNLQNWFLTSHRFEFRHFRPSSSLGDSYEDLSQKDEEENEVIEMLPQRQPSEKDFLNRKMRQTSDKDLLNRRSRLVRQPSTMETPVDPSGVVKMTYWF